MSVLPPYRDLSRRADGSPTAWGVLDEPGAECVLGRWGLVDAAVTRAALTGAVAGEVVSLNADQLLFDPALFGRRSTRREPIVVRDGYAVDEVLHDFYPQGSSQWDGLGHVSARTGAFYNGRTLAEVLAGANGIQTWASVGLVTRGVLLDCGDGRPVGDPSFPHPIGVDDLENARARAGVAWRRGDLLVLRTGYVGWYERLEFEARHALATSPDFTAAGLAHEESVVEYLWDHGIIGVASDSPTVEVWPPGEDTADAPFGRLHRILIAELGFALGELWSLDRLAARCSALQRWDFLLTSAHFPFTAAWVHPPMPSRFYRPRAKSYSRLSSPGGLAD